MELEHGVERGLPLPERVDARNRPVQEQEPAGHGLDLRGRLLQRQRHPRRLQRAVAVSYSERQLFCLTIFQGFKKRLKPQCF